MKRACAEEVGVGKVSIKVEVGTVGLSKDHQLAVMQCLKRVL